jgi:glutathione S-transferase
MQDLTRFHIDQWIDWTQQTDIVSTSWIYFILGMRDMAEAPSSVPLGQKRLEAMLEALEQHMSSGRKWLVGEEMTLAVRKCCCRLAVNHGL